MSGSLVDTTTIVDYSKDAEPQTSRLRSRMSAGEELGVCPVVVAEFFSGVAPHERERWLRFFAGVQFWEIPFEVAMRAGMDWYDLARRGIQVSTQDALIAAVARARDAAIITDNVRDFPQGDVPAISLREPNP